MFITLTGASADLPVPKLVVKYVDEADLDDLKGMMRYKKASQGDKYKSFAVTDTGDVGRVDVDIIYVDQTGEFIMSSCWHQVLAC